MSFSSRALAAGLLAAYANLSVAQSLSFAEAIAIASRDAPALAGNAAQIEAARQAGVAAGALPDPKLLVGIDNLPVDGSDSYSLSADFMTMQRIGLMQEFPSHAKRDARVAGAQGRIAVAEAQLRVTRLSAMRQVAVAWIGRDTVEKQLEQIKALVADNQLFDAAVRARLAGNQGAAMDALTARQEGAVIEDLRDELNSRLEQAIASLRQWIGSPAAESPLAGEAPDWPIDSESLLQGLQHHPEFALLDAQEQTLDAGIAEARAAKRPDWSMELAYQKRGRQFSNMVSLQFSVDLPVFAGSRQNPMIAERHAERRVLDSERESELREHTQMLQSDLAEYRRLRRVTNRLREVVVPLADEKVTLMVAAWRAGKIGLTDVLTARRERIEAGLKLIALEGEAKQRAASLHYAYSETAGEPL